MTSIIKTEGLNVGYDQKVVIENVNIDALKGQTICLIGPNGAGKSTILRTLSGLLAPVDGIVYIGKENIHNVKPSVKAKFMAVVLTEKLKVDMTTAYEIVSMGRIPYTGFLGVLTDEDHKVVKECMEKVGATSLANRRFKSLSDGEKQKVLIARALAQEPELIILDEPTSHLDIKHKLEVMQILNDLACETGLTVILALHDIDIAVKACQNVLMVKAGKVVAQGRPEDIVKNDTIEKLYNIKGASYDALLGSVELCNEAKPEVFILAGAGTGIPVYRMASRMGYGLVTGILHENDIDYRVAKSMKMTTVAEKSFQPIEEATILEAKNYLKKARFAIDTGFPIGEYNYKNIEIMNEFLKNNKVLFCMRDKEEAMNIYDLNSNVICVNSIGELHSKISKYLVEGGDKN